MGDLAVDEVRRHHADDLAARCEGGVRQLCPSARRCRRRRRARTARRERRPRGRGRPSRRTPRRPRWNRRTRRPPCLDSAAIGPGSHAANEDVMAVDQSDASDPSSFAGMTTSPAAPDLAAASDVVDLADQAVGTAIRQLTASGGPDVHQVLAYDLAHAASAVATAKALLDYGAKGDVEARITCAFVADVVHDLVSKLIGREQLWGVDPASLSRRARLRRRLPRSRLRRFPRRPGRSASPRATTWRWCRTRSASFANNVVAPHAEHVHRTNGDVPGGDHHRARRDRCVRPERARRLRRLQRGRRRASTSRWSSPPRS